MNTKKYLSFSAAIIITYTSFTGAAHATSYASQFKDVPSNHWAKDAINYVVTEGIMTGKNATEFAPDAPLTRADLAMLFYTLSGAKSQLDALNNISSSFYKDLDEATDTVRRYDINSILNAIYQYAIDNNGKLPFKYASSKPIRICRTNTVCPKNMIDLRLLVDSYYIVAVPVDPESKSKKSTDYTISITKEKEVTVSAPLAKGNISVTR